MKEFIAFYRWGMQVKLHMALYTVALVLFKCLTELWMGRTAVDSLVLLEMLGTCFLAALVEYFLFPAGRTLSRRELAGRTALWALACNLLIVGAAGLFKWFAGLPLWSLLLLVLLLEAGLFAMWFGQQVALKKDTSLLNQKLRLYQTQQEET